MGFLIGLLGFISGSSAHEVPAHSPLQGQEGGCNALADPLQPTHRPTQAGKPIPGMQQNTETATLAASQRHRTKKMAVW